MVGLIPGIVGVSDNNFWVGGWVMGIDQVCSLSAITKEFSESSPPTNQVPGRLRQVNTVAGVFPVLQLFLC